MNISNAAQHRGLLVFHLALLLATVAPMLSVEIPPLADLPNHLARLHILANLETIPALKENYQVVPTITPNLLVDWMLTPMARIWSVYDVGRAFVVASMAITYGGVLLLNVMLSSRLTVWPALALPILYNHAFSWGFLNFNFGVGVVLWAFALWLCLRKRNAVVRSAALLSISAVLYLTHMLAFGLFAAVVSAHSLSVAYRQNGPRAVAILRELISVIPPFVLTLVAYVLWLENDEAVGKKLIDYGDITRKPAALVSPTMFSDSLADGVLLMFYLIAGLHLARRKKMLLAENMALPLICLAIICLVMPNTLLGVWGVDFRLPPVLLMLLIAATQPETLMARPQQKMAAIMIATVVMARVVTVWPQLQQANRQFLEFKNATHTIAEGSRVLVSGDDIPGRLALPERAYLNLALIAVIERNAFVPGLFTGNMQVRPAARNREIDAVVNPAVRSEDIVLGLDPDFSAYYLNRTDHPNGRVYWAGWPKHFDYLVRINPAPLDDRVSAELETVLHYSYFEIARIRKSK
jgi:hypothetical protein